MQKEIQQLADAIQSLAMAIQSNKSITVDEIEIPAPEPIEISTEELTDMLKEKSSEHGHKVVRAIAAEKGDGLKVADMSFQQRFNLMEALKAL